MGKIFLYVLLLVVVIVIGGYVVMFSPVRFAQPYKILGGNPGSYRDGDYVLTMSKNIYGDNNVKKGDVVLFEMPLFNEQGSYIGNNDLLYVGEVKGIEGDTVTEAVYTFDNKPASNVVPSNSIFVTLNNSSYTRVLLKNNVTDVVWYPKK